MLDPTPLLFSALPLDIMNENLAEITSDVVDRISRLESGLLQIQEQARVQLDALNHLLQLLQCLPSLGESQILRNAPSAPVC
jgi:hypothetical protein